jgi:hypothetical protein
MVDAKPAFVHPYFSSHFPFTSVGRITKTDENFAWEFVDSSSEENQAGSFMVREVG